MGSRAITRRSCSISSFRTILEVVCQRQVVVGPDQVRLQADSLLELTNCFFLSACDQGSSRGCRALPRNLAGI